MYEKPTLRMFLWDPIPIDLISDSLVIEAYNHTVTTSQPVHSVDAPGWELDACVEVDQTHHFIPEAAIWLYVQFTSKDETVLPTIIFSSLCLLECSCDLFVKILYLRLLVQDQLSQITEIAFV